MITITGKGASDGVALGKIRLIRREPLQNSKSALSSSSDNENRRVLAAIQSVGEELDRLYESALSRIGESEAAIFEIHKMMLEDEDFTGEISRLIDEGHSADEAVRAAGETIARRFREMDTEYMRARAADILAVSGRVSEVLCGRKNILKLTEPVIVAADDLTPAETVGLDRDMLLGFITEGGSDMSHTAILARMMGIPAIVSAGALSDSIDGKTAMLDGGIGKIYIDPDEETTRGYRESVRRAVEETHRLELMRGKRLTNTLGERIYITANIGEPADVDEAVRNDAEGIGLFRSEFIFMRRQSPPTEDEQFEIYKSAAEKMGGNECVVRTLDVGADKKIPYLSYGKGEANPALGIRAIRLCLRMPELLLTQFRALYRAAAFGNISAMIPMIVLPSEVEHAMEIAREARDSLRKENIPYGEMKIGIMIETPSAAVLSDLLAPLVDFFSIGTNDLVQYTLAADRENPDVAYLTKPIPESVRRFITMTCDAARREGIPVCVCGELGAETEETGFLLDAGVTKLSVSPAKILKVREKAATFAKAVSHADKNSKLSVTEF